MRKVFAMVIGMVVMTGCSVTEVVRGPVFPADSVVRVVVAPTSAALVVGQQLQFAAVAKNALNEDIPDKQFAWTSTTPAVASVTTAGRVTGISSGTTTVRATINGVMGEAPVAVSPTPVGTVILSPSSATVFLGQTVTPNVQLGGPNDQLITGRLVEWTSLTPSVATVNPLGVITAVNVGTATLRASSDGKTANFTLTVNTRPAAFVTIAAPTNVHVGRTATFAVQVRDVQENLLPLTGRDVRWTVNNTAVATITNVGVVRGLGTGALTVGVLVDDKLATVNTTVTAVPIATLAANLSENPVGAADTVLVRVGFTRQFSAVARDSENVVIDTAAMAGRTITWSTETPRAIAVSNTGLVTGIEAGDAVLVAAVNGVVTRRYILVIP